MKAVGDHPDETRRDDDEENFGRPTLPTPTITTFLFGRFGRRVVLKAQFGNRDVLLLPNDNCRFVWILGVHSTYDTVPTLYHTSRDVQRSWGCVEFGFSAIAARARDQRLYTAFL